MGWRIFWLVLTGVIAASCADPSRNLYNGIKMRNESMQTPEERAASPTPSYDQYRKERDKLEKGDSADTPAQ